MAPFLKLAHSFHYVYSLVFDWIGIFYFCPVWLAGWLAGFLPDGMAAWLSKVPYVPRRVLGWL